MRYQGRITQWKDEQGFGFITPNGSGEAVFVHIKAFNDRKRRPVGNELVSYELSVDARGRGRAEKVAFVGECGAVSRRTGGAGLPVPVVSAFVLALLAGSLSGMLPVAILLLYVVASAMAFAAYAWDKAAARRGQWRTPESTLHFYGLIGGWPGAFVAQRLLRHKSSKREFQSVYWTTVVINCMALGWLIGGDHLHRVDQWLQEALKVVQAFAIELGR